VANLAIYRIGRAYTIRILDKKRKGFEKYYNFGTQGLINIPIGRKTLTCIKNIKNK